MDFDETVLPALKRYEFLQPIGKGGMGHVYRVRDVLTGDDVALKKVTIATDDLRFNSQGSYADARLSITREFETLATLRHPNIISVLDYGFTADRQPYFTMEYLSDALPISQYARDVSFETQVNLVMQMLQALSYLHHRGVLHRDIKPDNVLVVNGNVKMLDFGLAMTLDYSDPAHQRDEVVGTLAYIAPEVLHHTQFSIASDLFAVGVMACEIFTGTYPFDDSSVSALIQSIGGDVPTFPESTSPELRSILLRLLQKHPGNRYRTTQELMQAMTELQPQATLQETKSIRESFLQSARFVGREEELSTLMQTLLHTTDARSEAWLIGGESGIGKSRLLDELRIRALVEGFDVLRGEARRSGGAAYAMWRTPLQHLALQAELTPFEARVLKPLVPGVARFIGEVVEDAPDVDALATRNRLYDVIEGLFTRRETPTLVLLDDVQWASDEELDLLARLITALQNSRVMIVAAFRSEERAALPQRLPLANHMSLSRLDDEEVVALSESMLGSAGRKPQVVDLLQRETEGNVFFMVEVARELAERAGSLQDIGRVTLPQTIFAGGIQAAIERRLARVPDEAQPLLRVAGIAGRELDVAMLRQVPAEMSVDEWLLTCAGVGVLDVQDDRWRFAHDKLREGVLASLTADETRQLHATVAGAIEAAYDELDAQAESLVYHWNAAGNDAKEREYILRAGEQALQKGVPSEAIRYFERAEDLLPDENPQVYEGLGNAFDAAGQFSISKRYYRRALAQYGFSLPDGKAGLIGSIAWQTLMQAGHRLGWMRSLPTDADSIAYYQHMSHLHLTLQLLCVYTDDTLGAMQMALYGLNFAERIPGVSAELAANYGSVAYICMLLGWRSQTNAYLQRAMETVAQVDEVSTTMAQAHNTIGSVTAMLGQWEPTDEHLNISAAYAREVGDNRRWTQAIAQLAFFDLLRGNLADVIERCDTAYDAAGKRGDVQVQVVSLSHKTTALLLLGRLGQALDSIDDIEAFIAQQPEGDRSTIWVRGIVALTHLHAGNVAQAEDTIDRTVARLAELEPSANWILEGYSATVEVTYALLDASDKTDTAEYMRFEQAVTLLKSLAHSFDVWFPRWCLWEGVRLAHIGQREDAQAVWQQGLEMAARVDLPLERARIWHWMAHVDFSNADTDQAQTIFDRYGVTYYRTFTTQDE